MTYLTAAIALLFLLAGLTPAQQRTTFTVGSATAARGQKATGAIEVPAGSDAALSIPVAVFHGAKPGPVLALVSGAHGTEYASIIALEKLIGVLNPAEMSGTVIIVPLVNIPSFEQKVPHVNPVDRKSMNRMYPGIFADLIAVSGDPLTEIDALRNVHFVMKNGMVFKKDGVMTPEKFFHPGPVRTPSGRWTR